MHDLTVREAALLTSLWKHVHDAAEIIEQLRPAGGFNESIKPNEKCPLCGREKYK